MPTLQQIDPIVKKVESLLKQAEARGIHLKVSDPKLDDDWLYAPSLSRADRALHKHAKSWAG